MVLPERLGARFGRYAVRLRDSSITVHRRRGSNMVDRVTTRLFRDLMASSALRSGKRLPGSCCSQRSELLRSIADVILSGNLRSATEDHHVQQDGANLPSGKSNNRGPLSSFRFQGKLILLLTLAESMRELLNSRISEALAVRRDRAVAPIQQPYSQPHQRASYL
jgi:hypothetical protein